MWPSCPSAKRSTARATAHLRKLVLHLSAALGAGPRVASAVVAGRTSAPRAWGGHKSGENGLSCDVRSTLRSTSIYCTQMEDQFAEYACAQPGRLARKPANLSFVQAAAIPVSGLTALQAVRDQGHVQAGQKVLVIGASGGVGTARDEQRKSR